MNHWGFTLRQPILQAAKATVKTTLRTRIGTAAVVLAMTAAAAPAQAAPAANSFDSGLNVSNPLPVPDLKPAASQQKTLVIGLDGIRWDRVQAANTPNIKKILNEGASALSYTFAPANGAGTVNLAPTVSGPSWSSILTGVWPDKHGVKDNSFKGKKFDQYPDFLIRAEQAKPALSTFAAADWQPIAMEAGGGPIINKDIDYRYGSAASGTRYLSEDAREADLTARTIYEKRTDISFIYMGAPDENVSGGVFGSAYKNALEATDKNVGAMLRAIESSPSFGSEDWRVILTNDHGLTDGGSHGNGTTLNERAVYTAVYTPGKNTGQVRYDLKPVDIAPTVLKRAGVAIDPAWGFDGQPVDELQPDAFDSLRSVLQNKKTEPEIPADLKGYTQTAPSGWSIDNSKMPTGGVPEWYGWTFTTNEFWSSPADDKNQGRENFVRGRDVIAVADSDAWDDLNLPKSSRAFDSTLYTPTYDAAGSASVTLDYQTQYQHESGQVAQVVARWDNGSSSIVKSYSTTTAGPEKLSVKVPAGARSVQFGFRYAGTNNWFWALDQVSVTKS